MRPRVVVTGVGTISSISGNAPGFVDALREGRRGLVELNDPRLKNLKATHAALIRDIRPNPEDPWEVRCLDRNVHIALRALREALEHAGLAASPLGPRGGIVFGTCSGGMLSIEKHYENLVNGEDLIDPDLLFSKLYYTTARVLAWAAGAGGPTVSVVTACAAGSGAIAQGADLIRAGMADIIIAGGSDSFSPSTLAGFDALKATTDGMCAPFSTPIGLNLGEGSAFLVLESLEHAVGRGADLIGELLGTGLSNDAYHPTAPDPTARGQIAAMSSALFDAGISPEQIDYINAHGTGTRANDPAETRAVRRLFGDRASAVPISSTKSMTGHCLGGAGALEASATLLCAAAGFFPPTAGFSEGREGCDLDYVPDPGRPWKGRVALSNSFGFAGNNACLVLDVSPKAEAPHRDPPVSPRGPVVITGLGLVSPLGVGTEPLLGTDLGVREIERFAVPATPFPAGLVPHIDPREIDRRLDLKGMDLCSRYATLAARRALDEAGIKPRPRIMEQVGFILGIATGPGQGENDHLRAIFESDFKLQRLGAFPYVVPNEVAGHVARSLMLKGHSTVLAAGPGAGLASTISAVTALEQGHVDTVLAAASDELTERSVSDGHKVGFWGPSTPAIPGEGAAVLVLERRDTTEKRGGKILAEVLGCAMITDCAGPRSGDVDALQRRVLEEALTGAGIDAAGVSLVAHGGPAAAGCDDSVIRDIFGDGAEPISLAPRLGFAEASLPLFNLGYLIATGEPGSTVISTFASSLGFACAIVVRLE